MGPALPGGALRFGRVHGVDEVLIVDPAEGSVHWPSLASDGAGAVCATPPARG